jgi:hypothetical protein
VQTRFQAGGAAGASSGINMESHRFLASGQVAVDKSDMKAHFSGLILRCLILNR